MKVKALVSFAGVFSMGCGEVKECSDKAILLDLLQAGYIEKVVPIKDVKPNENKHNARK